MGVFFGALALSFVLTLLAIWGRSALAHAWRRLMGWRFGRTGGVVPVYMHGKVLAESEPTPEPTPPKGPPA